MISLHCLRPMAPKMVNGTFWNQLYISQVYRYSRVFHFRVCYSYFNNWKWIVSVRFKIFQWIVTKKKKENTATMTNMEAMKLWMMRSLLVMLIVIVARYMMKVVTMQDLFICVLKYQWYLILRFLVCISVRTEHLGWLNQVSHHRVSITLDIFFTFLKYNSFVLSDLDNCPNGYEYQKGDAEGVQYAIRGPSGLMYSPFSSINDCAKICDGITACKAIEWSPSQLKCVLINISESNGPKYMDYDFCKKGIPKETISIHWNDKFISIDIYFNNDLIF